MATSKGPPSVNGRDGWWSRLPILWDPEDRSATGSERTTLEESRHLAYQRRAKRGESPRWSLGGPPRTGELCFSRDPFGRYPKDFFGGTGYGYGPWPPYCSGGGIPLWMWHIRTMPRSYGRYWWRRQDPHHLRWLLGRCQCTHSGQYRRTHHSPYSHGLPPRHSLVAGVTKRTGTQEAPLCTLGLAQTGWPVDAPEGGCHEGSQESEDTATRVEIPGGKTRGRVVDKQSGHIWYGQCATLLGASCLDCASPLVSCLSHGGLGFCLCGWLLLAPAQITCWTTHKCHPPFSGGLWLPVELEEDSHRPLQHLVGVHHDPRPTTSPDGTYQTRIGHCSVRQNDGQPDLHEARIGQCPGEVAVGNQLLPTHKTIPSGLLAMEIGG